MKRQFGCCKGLEIKFKDCLINSCDIGFEVERVHVTQPLMFCSRTREGVDHGCTKVRVEKLRWPKIKFPHP